MSTLIDSKTNSKIFWCLLWGKKKWKKKIRKSNRNDAGDTARTCMSCLDKRDADGEGRGDRQQEVLDGCFSLV